MKQANIIMLRYAVSNVTPCYYLHAYICAPCPVKSTAPWKWRQQAPPNRLYPIARSHGITILMISTGNSELVYMYKLEERKTSAVKTTWNFL